MNSFGDRLREERERLGVSQEVMGEMGGVKKLAQRNYENGSRSPSASYLTLVAGAGVDVTYVLTGVRMPPELQDYIRRMLKVTAENDPDGTGSLTAHAGQAIKQIGVEQARRQALQQLIARCSTDDLDMIEPLIKRLIQ
jgi:transcriptional regulator with XRE-family HTH domain